MSQIVKAFTGVFVVLYMMITSMGILSCFLQVSHAQNTHAAMIDEIENSNFSPRVIEACFQAANTSDYQLEITLYHNNTPFQEIQRIEQVPVEITDIKLADVRLNYTVELAFFQLQIEQQLQGYAR